MSYWSNYKAKVDKNCAGSGNDLKDLSYWRNNLFAGAIIYLLPLCFIALLPGVYLSFITGLYVLAVVDLLSLTGIAMVAFMPGITLTARKIIFMCSLYAVSIALLYYLGLYGPGLVYLLATCLLGIFIFTTTYTFWPAWLNTFICFTFVLALSLDIIPWPPLHDNRSVKERVGISSNLVFLSFLLAALIPRLFNGLQQTIDNEKQLKEALNKQQQSLQEALNMLQQKNLELEQFAYIASHDLNEPTRMVISFMGLLKNKYGNQLDEKAHTYMDFAIDGGKRMQRMISDLLELSRSARQDGVRESVNLDEIVHEVKQNIFKLIEENRVEIIVKKQFPVLSVYRSDISRLLQNLLTNAIKFRKKEIAPVIGLNATEKESVWLFSIEDNGIGIEQEQFEKIFEIFTRLHSRETYEGSGIGLAVCKKVVEHHGGRIWVESDQKKGSVFYFTLKK